MTEIKYYKDEIGFFYKRVSENEWFMTRLSFSSREWVPTTFDDEYLLDDDGWIIEVDKKEVFLEML